MKSPEPESPTRQPLDYLWDLAGSPSESVSAGDVAEQPDPLQTYLRHSIAPGTPLAQAVRLKMQGQIKLGRWHPFQAEEVIIWDQGMIWQATVRWHGLPIRGADQLLEGQGRMQWKLLGLFPILTAMGEDITRSTVGRIQAESIWLPSVLWQRASWTVSAPHQLQARLAWQGICTPLYLEIDPTGRLQTLQLNRWGNPDGGSFQNCCFGGVVESEGTFMGYTIPTQLRIGWYPGTDRFAAEGEFFRVQITDAIYR